MVFLYILDGVLMLSNVLIIEYIGILGSVQPVHSIQQADDDIA